MDETIVPGSDKNLREDPHFFALMGGTGRTLIRQAGEFVSAGRHEGNHLVFAYNAEVSSQHAVLWYGALDGRPKRALYAIDVSRNGVFLPSQDVAIKDVPRWRSDARALKKLADGALAAIEQARRGIGAVISGFVPADHPSFPANMQLEYKEAALQRMIERLASTVGIACLDDLAPPGKEMSHLRMVRDPSNQDVVRIEAGVLRLKERAANR